MKLVTPREMKAIDKKAINEIGIPGIVLMENAGIGLFELIREESKEIEDLKVGIICGKGNNGGDGFVLARHLLNNGAQAQVFLLGNIHEIKGDARINLDILLKMGLKINELTTKKSIRLFKQECEQFDLLVDAIFGTGFSGKVEGIAKGVINVINAADVPVLAIDIPSGLNAVDGSIEGDCVMATFTGTMCLPKRGLFLYPGKDYAGDIAAIDIGVPPGLWQNIDLELLESSGLLDILPSRPDNSNKGTFGKVFVLAGSRGMTGAAALSSMSALKIGAGLVRLGISESLNPILEQKVTEVITVPLPGTQEGTLSQMALNKILKEIENSTVVVIGPGLSTHPDTKKLIQNLAPKIGVPLVIDADGLNNLTPEIIKKIKSPTIITPHPGELSRLTNLPISEIQANCVDITFRFAREFGVTLVLKGAPTIIVGHLEAPPRPDSRNSEPLPFQPNNNGYLSPFYNSGLASGGSGDVLTGMIAGLLAQGLIPVDAARLGVYLHGLAGDIVAKQLTEYSVIASDVMEAIPEAIKELVGGQVKKET